MVNIAAPFAVAVPPRRQATQPQMRRPIRWAMLEPMTSSSVAPAGEVRYRHVLVPLDGSQFAAAALRTAHVLADRFGADVHAISVAEHRDDVDGLRSAAGELLGPDGDERVHVVVGDDPATATAGTAAAPASPLPCRSTHARARGALPALGSAAR